MTDCAVGVDTSGDHPYTAHMFSASWNPPNRFRSTEIDWDEPPPPPRLVIEDDDTQGILSRNQSPDIPFEWGVNPYRGCTHACAYCYARTYHEYLGLGAGADFERRILVKRRAPELLEQALRRPSWDGAPIALSGATDCYQPLERKLELTRCCLAVAARFRQPVGIITRSPLVTRDLDLLKELARWGAVRVGVSIPVLDPDLARALEPGAPPPSARLAAVAALHDAGIPVGVSLAPLIPGISDRLLPRALEAAREAGARWAFAGALRLPGSVAAVFERRLRERLPDKADAVLARIRRSRGGGLDDTRFFQRQRSDDRSWQASFDLFDLWVRRLGFPGLPPDPAPSPFQRPGQGQQLALFGT